MIIHRTSYGFYDSPTEEAKIIEDCRRSQSNASKIYHRINPIGDIIQSKRFDRNTEQLIIETTTEDMKKRSYTQRQWALKHAIISSNKTRSQKQTEFNALADRLHFPREKLDV